MYLKKVRTDSDELRIVEYLNTEQMRQDVRNRSVPILDTVPHPDKDFQLIVMPFLRYIDSPRFVRVEDILHCGQQLLEVRSRSTDLSII